MNKIIIMALVVLSVLGVWSAQFEITEQLKEEPMHMGLYKLSDIDKLDNNGEMGALIIISCGLEDVFFKNMASKISQNKDGGSYLVVMKKRAQYFVICKEGFGDEQYNFPTPLEGKTVYRMAIDEKNTQAAEVTLVITSNQNNALVFINGTEVGKTENKIFTGNIPLGNQKIELRKSGYKTKAVTHSVSPENNRVEINLDLPFLQPLLSLLNQKEQLSILIIFFLVLRLKALSLRKELIQLK